MFKPIYSRMMWLLLAVACIAQPMLAQLTLKINSIPGNTPANAAIYVAGTMNNWDPGNAAWQLALQPDGTYSITFTPANGTVEFKFTRGGWPTVEGNANGTFLPNRTTTYNGQPKTLNLSVQTWEDLGPAGGGGGSNGQIGVQVLSNNFNIPQLNRTRRIWLYLPPDYSTNTAKHYPVLYMHDGQNLFDPATSFAGEWGIDEALNSLHANGDYGCIVVGIDNGGIHRLDEYSPWINLDYGGGEGDEYIDFIVNTLKPHIDANYRTLPGRITTGIMGSSMGGLISMYGFSEHQEVFSRAGIFSPAFWFAGSQPATHVAAHARTGDARVYFLAGGQEPAYVEEDMQEVADAMTTAGFLPAEKQFVVPADGQHSEWFWKREFPAAYQWLFANTVSATGIPKPESVALYPNPAANEVRFTGFEAVRQVAVQIIGLDGRLWQDTLVQQGQPVQVGDIPAGMYLVRLRNYDQSGAWQVLKMVKQ